MSKPNKEVLEKEEDQLREEIKAVSEAEKDILNIVRDRLHELRLDVKSELVDVEEIMNRLSDVLSDEFFLLNRDLKNRLENL